MLTALQIESKFCWCFANKGISAYAADCNKFMKCKNLLVDSNNTFFYIRSNLQLMSFLLEGKMRGEVNSTWTHFSIFCVLKKGCLDYLQAVPAMEMVARTYLADWVYVTFSYSQVLEEQKGAKELSFLKNTLFPSSEKLSLCPA